MRKRDRLKKKRAKRSARITARFKEAMQRRWPEMEAMARELSQALQRGYISVQRKPALPEGNEK